MLHETNPTLPQVDRTPEIERLHGELTKLAEEEREVRREYTQKIGDIAKRRNEVFTKLGDLGKQK